MKKILFVLLAGIFSTVTLQAAITNPLEDSSLVRISSAQARAEFLNILMKEKLGLTDKEYPRIQDLNAKYEEELQKLTIAHPASPFGNQTKKKDDTPFDKLSEAREKDMKKIMTGKQFKLYEEQRWSIRMSLKREMWMRKEERDRVVQEEQAKKAAIEKARTDSIAAVQAAAEKKAEAKPAKGKKEKSSSKKEVTKKDGAKKGTKATKSSKGAKKSSTKKKK